MILKTISGGACEICDMKFEDENAHFESPRHKQCLLAKRVEFERISRFCDSNFPTNPSSLFERLNELTRQPQPDSSEMETSQHSRSDIASGLEESQTDGGNDFTKLRHAENAVSDSSSSEKKAAKSSTDSNLNSTADWLGKELLGTKESPETDQRGREMSQHLTVLTLDRPDEREMKRKAPQSYGIYNPSLLTPSKNESERDSPIIFSILERVSSQAKPKETHSPVILSKFAPPPDKETRSPALKKACIQNSVGGGHFSLETARNLKTDALELRKPEADGKKTPPRSSAESPPLPAPVLSALVISPKESKTAQVIEEAKSSPKTLATLEKCSASSPGREEAPPPPDGCDFIDQSLEVISRSFDEDREVNAILHADGSEFKTPQKPKPDFRLKTPPNKENNHVYFPHSNSIGKFLLFKFIVKFI